MIPVIRVAVSAMIMTAAAGLASAQDAAPSGSDKGLRYVPPVSVTATKNPIETFEYPGMVTVRDRRSIQDRQATSPDDILRTVPGVDFFGGPRRTGEGPQYPGVLPAPMSSCCWMARGRISFPAMTVSCSSTPCSCVGLRS